MLRNKEGRTLGFLGSAMFPPFLSCAVFRRSEVRCDHRQRRHTWAVTRRLQRSWERRGAGTLRRWRPRTPMPPMRSSASATPPEVRAANVSKC